MYLDRIVKDFKLKTSLKKSVSLENTRRLARASATTTTTSTTTTCCEAASSQLLQVLLRRFES